MINNSNPKTTTTNLYSQNFREGGKVCLCGAVALRDLYPDLFLIAEGMLHLSILTLVFTEEGNDRSWYQITPADDGRIAWFETYTM